MFFTVNPPYKANIVFGSFLPHSYGSHKKYHPHQKNYSPYFCISYKIKKN